MDNALSVNGTLSYVYAIVVHTFWRLVCGFPFLRVLVRLWLTLPWYVLNYCVFGCRLLCVSSTPLSFASPKPFSPLCSLAVIPFQFALMGLPWSWYKAPRFGLFLSYILNTATTLLYLQSVFYSLFRNTTRCALGMSLGTTMCACSNMRIFYYL